MIPLLSAILSATLVVPLLMSLCGYMPIRSHDLTEGMLAITAFMLTTLIHVLLLGVPAFFALRKRGWLKTRTIAAAGLFAGALPTALIAWPYPVCQRYPSSSSGTWHGRQVDFIADGLPTIFGWLNYLEGVATFGLLGVASALAFWFTWVYCNRTLPAQFSTCIPEAIDGFHDPRMK